jgi:hypothetical protein
MGSLLASIVLQAGATNRCRAEIAVYLTAAWDALGNAEICSPSRMSKNAQR